MIKFQKCSDKELTQGEQVFKTGWKITFPVELLANQNVDHLIVLLDEAFPFSQPRVFAPQLKGSISWPHIEANGHICLKATNLFHEPGERLKLHLNWAFDVLLMDPDERQYEFEREFGAYWGQRESSVSVSNSRVFSLVRPGGKSRRVKVYFSNIDQAYVIADTESELKSWLSNRGNDVNDFMADETLLTVLDKPWRPEQFPDLYKDLSLIITQSDLDFLLRQYSGPVIFEARTVTGPVLVSVNVPHIDRKSITTGFRSIDHMGYKDLLLRRSMEKLRRIRVERIDSVWINGRGKNTDLEIIQNKQVTIIGCGSLGSAIAKNLAQSGVGRLILVDPDQLNSANISRHILGISSVGRPKSNRLADYILHEFPHIEKVVSYPQKFENLSNDDLNVIMMSDLIITAGIDFESDMSVNKWRRSLPSSRPHHLCTWVEAYAVVGHALLITEDDNLGAVFDDSEVYKYKLTCWPEEHTMTEAGCGNVFQPHGITDLQFTVNLACQLAYDSLLGKVPISTRRAWLGRKEVVDQLNGECLSEFNESNVIREDTWP